MSRNRLGIQHSLVDGARADHLRRAAPVATATDTAWTRFDRRQSIMMAGRIFALGMGFALLAVACGGATTTSAPAARPAQTTVSVQQVPGVGNIYTDANGMALYTPDQEANGKVECTGPCTSIWIPLAAPPSGSPTEASGVPGTVGVITRPDGTRQVTLDGAPLYRFVQDTGAGTVNGNGITDSFRGVSFMWHVDSVGGRVTTSQSSPIYRYGN